MSDETPTTSGSRWEPTDSTDSTDSTEPTEADVEQPPAAAAPKSAATPPSWRSRARVGVAGAAVVGLLLAGLGGFAVGRATSGDDEPGIQQVGFQQDDDGDRDGDGFRGDRDGDGPGGPGEGFPPVPPAQVPGATTDGSAT